MDNTRLAIIGLGSWGTIVKTRLKEIPLTSLKYLCDKSVNHKDIINDYRNIPLDDIDGVLILTEPFSHYEIAKYFLENDKYVFIEKPITTSYKDFQGLIEYKNRIMPGDILYFHTFLNEWIRKYKPIDYLRIEWKTQRVPVFPLWWDNGAHVGYILQEWDMIDTNNYKDIKVEYFFDDLISFSFTYNNTDVEIYIERGCDRNSRRITTDRGVFQLEANPIDILIRELQIFSFFIKGIEISYYPIEKSGNIVKFLEEIWEILNKEYYR